MNLRYRFYDLPLKDAFTISRYTVTIQKTVIVGLSHQGQTGYGEATVNPYYQSTQERLQQALHRVQREFSRNTRDQLEEPAQFHKRIAALIPGESFALCALDTAYWDLYARLNSRTLRSYWSETDQTPKSSYTIGLDTVERMQTKIQQQPWPIYKIKLGGENDLECIQSLREVTSAEFRVDANCAWTVKQTLKYSREMKDLGVTLLEQPLAREQQAEMQLCFRESALPLMADESCQTEDDVKRCVGHFHSINIKLMKCGGITPALRMIQEARALGLQIMLGCMTESTVGISAAAQLAPLVDYLDLDGALLLAEDTAEGVKVAHGVIKFSENNGTGVTLKHSF
ncbi:dipeptide epimerase [Croceiramulus getboli]|nr:dipeptide epimerase [Flavobacteriaceae bacterium YJPT1-3]